MYLRLYHCCTVAKDVSTGIAAIQGLMQVLKQSQAKTLQVKGLLIYNLNHNSSGWQVDNDRVNNHQTVYLTTILLLLYVHGH